MQHWIDKKAALIADKAALRTKEHLLIADKAAKENLVIQKENLLIADKTTATNLLMKKGTQLDIQKCISRP